MVGGEFGTFENLDPAGMDISRGDKQFEFGQGPRLFEVDCLFEMIAQRIDVQGIEIVRARIMGEIIVPPLRDHGWQQQRKKQIQELSLGGRDTSASLIDRQNLARFFRAPARPPSR